ncbi:hypothetical protein [Geotalea uraniireducens]|uniref:Gram-positive cocci surface proteins LPxTG domain-containing protein n=1 Tax=Geotalea uraniireducens (strain Rf4) TaxID=351605 RepID=A5G8U6_GEOUR|nr:hypothetical protein [Geotalea uraniireducens]ABQ28214.1 hypothetical protein Gura_4071 [Geotalea uraniireducens Rf4]
MKRILTVLLAVLCFSFLVGSMAFAGALKSVYLKDGGVIECQKVWKTNGNIMVLVNRDVLLDFSRDEVDLKKTFGKKPAKTKKKGVKRQKIGAGRPPLPQKAIAQKPSARPIQGVVSSVQKPAKPVKPLQAVKAAPAPHAPPQPVAGALKAKPAVNPPVQGAAPAAKKPVPPAKAVPKSAIQPVQPPAEPPFSFTSSLMLQAAGGGVLIVLLVVLLAMRRKKG